MSITSERIQLKPIVIANPLYEKEANDVISELESNGFSPGERVHSVLNASRMANLIEAHVNVAQLDTIGEAALVVVGGDGTAAAVMRGLLKARQIDPDLSTLPILLAAGGFASDGRHATQAKNLKRPSEMLRHSSVRDAHWIERTTTIGDVVKTDIGMFYAGFGKTAYGSGLANDTPHRRMGTWHRKASIGLGTLMTDAYVAYDDGLGTIRRGDITFCLNSIMSGQFKMDTSLLDTKAYVVTTPEGFWPGLWKAMKLSAPNEQGLRTSSLQFQLTEMSLAHFDGEKPIALDAGTHVDLHVSKGTYPLLVSK